MRKLTTVERIMTPSGIEPMNFWLVAHCLNHKCSTQYLISTLFLQPSICNNAIIVISHDDYHGMTEKCLEKQREI